MGAGYVMGFLKSVSEIPAHPLNLPTKSNY